MNRPARGKLWNRDFICLCCLQLFMTIVFYSTMPMIALFLEKEVGLSGPVLGLVVVSATVGAVLARFLSGYAVDALGRRPVVWASFSLFTGLYFLYTFVAGAFSAAFLRFGHGVAWGAGMTSSTTAAVDVMPSGRRGEGVGYFTLVMIISMAVGPALGMLVSGAEGFYFLFKAAGILALGGLLLAVFWLRFPKITLKRPTFSLSGIFEKRALRLGVVVFFITVPYGFFMNYGAMYANGALSASAGLFYTIFALGTGSSRLFAGRVYDKYGPRQVIALSFILLILGLAAQSLSKNHAIFYLATFLEGLGDGMGLPVLLAMVNDLVPAERRGEANGTLMTFFELGICGGVMLTSLLYQNAGWPAALLALACSVAAAALAWKFLALPHYLRLSKSSS